MIEIPYALLAVRALLAEDPAVAEYAVDRVYVGELPEKQSGFMPRGALILSPAGGPADRSYVPLGRTRMDTRSYGRVPLEAMRLHLAVHRVLKNLTRTERLNCLIHDVVLFSGPAGLRDNEIGAEWPMVYASYGVLASEVSTVS